jgi:PTH2 family peptidyl-tRNA hydrolase
MKPGKLSSQAGHAYTDSLWACFDTDPDRARSYRAEGGVGGSKVTMEGKNLHALERAKRECEEAGIPCALVTDKDHIDLPHFDGSPVVSALGVGPCLQSEVYHITKRFQCVK